MLTCSRSNVKCDLTIMNIVLMQMSMSVKLMRIYAPPTRIAAILFLAMNATARPVSRATARETVTVGHWVLFKC